MAKKKRGAGGNYAKKSVDQAEREIIKAEILEDHSMFDLDDNAHEEESLAMVKQSMQNEGSTDFKLFGNIDGLSNHLHQMEQHGDAKALDLEGELQILRALMHKLLVGIQATFSENVFRTYLESRRHASLEQSEDIWKNLKACSSFDHLKAFIESTYSSARGVRSLMSVLKEIKTIAKGLMEIRAKQSKHITEEALAELVINLLKCGVKNLKMAGAKKEVTERFQKEYQKTVMEFKMRNLK